MALAVLLAGMSVPVNAVPVNAANDAPRNLQINGSFEYATNPDIPDYWAGPCRFYRANSLPPEWCDAAGLKEFRAKFVLDGQVAFHGSNSMCIQRPIPLLGMPMACATGLPYTVSVYLRGEFPDRQVRLAVTDRDTLSPAAQKTVTIGPQWTRHSLVLDRYPRSHISLQVVPLDSGKVWVDAVQIEAGDTATPFAPSPYDRGFTLPQPLAHPRPGADAIPELRLAAPAATPPAIDGLANDAAWSKAPTVVMNDYMGVPASVATRASFAYDRSALYLSFACDDPGAARGLGDSIEILIDPLGIGDPFYQFVFDARGGKRNYRDLHGIHEWTWNAEWQVATRVADGRWTAEVAIPFAALDDAAAGGPPRELRVNVCRNYAPGPEKLLSWVPVAVGFLEPRRFGRIRLGGDDGVLSLRDIGLSVSDAADSRFTLAFTAAGSAPLPPRMLAAITVEEEGQAAQLMTVPVKLDPAQPQQVSVPGITLRESRCRVTIVCSDPAGQVLQRARTFLDVPLPLRVYTEYSYYTTEREARIVAEFGTAPALPADARLALSLRVAGHTQKLAEKSFTAAPGGGRQFFTLPVSALTAAHRYALDARLLDGDGKELAQADALLVKLEPNRPEVKVNRINRGIYLNGEPYIPYGIQTASYGPEQLRYYKSCGFDFIDYISHWNSPEAGIAFLSQCESAGINVVAFHVARPGRLSPPDAVLAYRRCRSLIGVVPNDEEADRQVYGIADRTKAVYPHLLTWINHNFTSYMAFANRMEGLPGDVLSIDRYPLLSLPNGRPHTTSEIYSVERCAELMDRDGQRERMPVFFWLQGAERFSKEPTPTELTWLTYILLVNHCTGFTYFGGMPSSRYVWERMIGLNKEVQTLKPYLFSFDPEPAIGLAPGDSANYLRVLPKTLGKELLLVCVNRAMAPVDAAIDLSHAGQLAPGVAAVLFENRTTPIGKDAILRDRFEPLSRHVYKIGLR